MQGVGRAQHPLGWWEVGSSLSRSLTPDSLFRAPSCHPICAPVPWGRGGAEDLQVSAGVACLAESNDALPLATRMET